MKKTKISNKIFSRNSSYKNENNKKRNTPQAIQDVDEFVSSLEQVWRNVALHHLLISGCSAVNGCRQNESPNSWYKHHTNPNLIHTTPVQGFCYCTKNLTDEIPKIWKVAIVSPVYKSGDKTDPDSYRPISVLPCVAKGMEKCINKQLIGFINTNNILSKVQSGLVEIIWFSPYYLYGENKGQKSYQLHFKLQF